MDKELEARIRETVGGMGYSLYRYEYAKKGGEAVLTVMVDREEPISLKDIESVSEAVNALLDELDPIKEPYVLDVCSLGAEKPISLDRLEGYVGREVRLHLSHPYKGENILEGELGEVSADTAILLIKVKGKTLKAELSRKDIDVATSL